MVSMKIEDSGIEPMEPNPYGYSMSICLNEEQLTALGIDTLPEPGTVLRISALAKVEETEVEKDEEGVKREMKLQITDMDKPAVASAPIDAKAIYAKSGMS